MNIVQFCHEYEYYINLHGDEHEILFSLNIFENTALMVGTVDADDDEGVILNLYLYFWWSWLEMNDEWYYEKILSNNIEA